MVYKVYLNKEESGAYDNFNRALGRAEILSEQGLVHISYNNLFIVYINRKGIT